ncbi:venom protease-like isoform X2 [Daktulosphaira vitifoliae]|uniref:venom protease-like isoform X1 n=1 Tax=Daktulosphaira vitifoliae TaxID=58002 RepID=UPI0021A98405|nr:venom protease-like isoform X1 [Daktulosphaira vitifoliae]XP_050545996.1 venom protease-like isoform X2 [Daktulosphaira vitifoliae]
MNILTIIVCGIINLKICRGNLLQLNEGEVCTNFENNIPNYICRRHQDCIAAQNIHQRKNIRLCSFVGLEPIVCCPGNNKIRNSSTSEPLKTKISYTASEMCHQYSAYYRKYNKKSIITEELVKNEGDKVDIVGGTKTKPKEFPHMAMIGYGDSISNVHWDCGGSLISKEWVLTAAHCERSVTFGISRWVRLGELNYADETDDAKPEDYDIILRVSHPDYRQTVSRYNDIALYKLAKEVIFSEYILPICLNADPSLVTNELIATGWGQIEDAGPASDDLLKVTLNFTPVNQCNKTYSKNLKNMKLPNGILEMSQICAGSDEDGKDTCRGDSGGPLQVKNPIYEYGMFLQVGITSFGQNCGFKDSPGVYTKVSYYTTWIEKVIWSM